MDAETIERIGARLVRAIGALEGAFGAPIYIHADDEKDLLLSILAYLIKAELGRKPSESEVGVVLHRIARGSEEDTTKGGEQ